MKAHALQHVPFEGLGTIAQWLETCGAETTYARFFEDTLLPALDGIDLVIAMGGPMSVNDVLSFPCINPNGTGGANVFLGIAGEGFLLSRTMDGRWFAISSA